MIPEFLRFDLKHHAMRERWLLSRQRVYLHDNNLEIQNVSLVPAVFIVILVWAFCSVLLTLSASRQRDLSGWKEGMTAPFTVNAQADFKFINKAATEKAREDACRAVPEIFSHNSTKIQSLRSRLDEFFRQMKLRYDAVRKQRPFAPQSSLPAVLASKASLPLLEALSQESLQNTNYVAYANALRQTLGRGILREKDSLPRNAGQLLRTVDSNLRYSPGVLRLREMPTPHGAAIFLATALLPQNPTAAKELARLLSQLFGREGTLDYNAELTDSLRDKAAAAVLPVEQSCSKGDVLVRKGEVITPEILAMLVQEQDSLPRGLGIKVFYYRMAISFVLLAATLFFLYQLYPELFSDPQQFFIGGISVILALLANYGAIQLFSFLFREGRIGDYYLQVGAIPAMLGAVLVSAFLGNRSGIAVGFLTSSATAMMVMPDSSFELALRWMAISMLGALFVRNVTNYRSYFVRIFFGGFLLTLAVTSDLIFLPHHSWHIMMDGTLLVLVNSFFCAVTALVLVFVFELLFNADSNMALMVLCDYNHPLLERLKREAPGTMFHSMSVATLAEDAAHEIGANPLKAKAGALFHDIGKLVLPQYFVENNRDSSSEHLNLNPQMSSIIIRDHVKEGLILAEKYHLCRLVRSAIATHHGDDLVSYFYNRAIAENRNREPGSPVTPVLESQFRYSGLPPVGKELTIISLADACEAACRSLNKPTSGKIQAMIHDIFIKRLQGGQLRNSELTLAELDKVQACFITTLISIHHGRIAYQPEDMYESASKPLDAPAAAPAGK